VSVQRVFRVEHDGSPRYALEREGVLRLIEGDVFDGPAGYRVGDAITPSRILAPVQPSKIVCIGLNYRDHATEVHASLPAEPLIFLKPSTAVVGPGDAIRIPPGVGRVDHEAELGVVIGRRAYRVPRERAHDVVLGLTCVNDVTARDVQARDGQWSRAKGFDTFAPIGPCIAIGLDAGSLDIEGWVNDERRQASNTRQLIFPIEELVAYVSSVMTLLPGDIISTGTPAGIGAIKAGDRVRIRIGGIGELVNPVTD
jgi:2-keto-4-pentenoate hydratase/2-oxohepta-3-ene-1,7-dioic acid hydratase in catechol pathway